MGVARRPSATYADLVALPDHLVGEIVAGDLYASPRPAPRHSLAASALGGELFAPFKRGRGGPGGWVILDEPEIHQSNDVVVPDLAGWRRERMPEVPTDLAYFTLAPDWAAEVLSPSTSRLDRGAKSRVYAREGVKYLWFIDPVLQILEVMILERERYTVALVESGDAKVRAQPFEAIELDLAVLWEL